MADVKRARLADTQSAKYNVIIVSSNPKALPAHIWELVAASDDNQIINFYTTNMDELSVIAKHRVMPIDTILVLQSGKVMHRIVGVMPTEEGLRKILSL